MKYDVLIIGAGIVGSSIAFELSKYDLKVAVVEKENDVSLGTTKANSGIVHAGCRGNINAKVRALKINAVQLRIGNCYSRRPDGTNIPYVIKTSIFTPEEARVVNDEIVLFKINQN